MARGSDKLAWTWAGEMACVVPTAGIEGSQVNVDRLATICCQRWGGDRERDIKVPIMFGLLIACVGLHYFYQHHPSQPNN
jgi:hypothetical protein